MPSLSFSWILISIGALLIFLFLLLPFLLKLLGKLLPDGPAKSKRANPTREVSDWIEETQSKRRRR